MLQPNRPRLHLESKYQKGTHMLPPIVDEGPSTSNHVFMAGFNRPARHDSMISLDSGKFSIDNDPESRTSLSSSIDALQYQKAFEFLAPPPATPTKLDEFVVDAVIKEKR